MPPKKYIKKRIDIKLKRAIESRLMQLSLMVDDYIYKKKPICVEDAQNYKQEIMSFKHSCHKDVRSLQVIDKLSRLLQRIIEDQTSAAQIETETYCNSDIIHTDSLNEPNNKTNCPFEADISQNLEHINSDTICNVPKNNPDNASSLSISKDTEHVQIEVLNNVEIINPIASNQIAQDRTKESIHLTNTESNDIDAINERSNKNLSKDISSNIMATGNKFQRDQIQESNNPEANSVVLQPIEKHTNKFKNKDDNRNTNNTLPIDTSKMYHNIKTVHDTILSHSTVNNKRDNLYGNKLSMRKQIATINTLEKPNALNSKNKIKKSRSHLSWIENIKYIREVKDDEYDSKLKQLTQSFWDNCTFPNNWDESDFLLD